MSVVTTEIQETVEWEGSIAEMGPLDSSTHPELRIPEDFLTLVRSKDNDPLFVTVEIEAGMSKSKRLWKIEHLKTVVDKVNKERMAGNLGHPLLDKEKYEREFPIPQVAWAVAKQEGNKAYFKGYVLKTAQARELLELKLIDGVSIFGDSRMRPIQGGYEILSFEPETIDFARKGRSGMKSRIVALTGEEHEGTKGGQVEPKDVAALSPDEIKTHAPLVYKAIQDEAVAPLNTKVGEMETAAVALQTDADLLTKIKEALKLTDGENPVEKITNLLQKIEDAGSAEIKAFVHELISKKVKTERGQALLRRLIGEMETEYEGPLTDELKTKITNDFETKVDGDDDIKELVGEMVNLKDEPDDRGGGGTSLGGRSRAGNTRGRNDGGGDDGVVRRTENITVRKQKVGA